jgi:hypothetical protein
MALLPVKHEPSSQEVELLYQFPSAESTLLLEHNKHKLVVLMIIGAKRAI